MPWHEFRTNVRHLPAHEQERVKNAFELGKKMHEGQTRRSGEPYFNHPIAVAHMLADMGADSDTVIAALLHDTVEDTPLTLEEIDRIFGKDVTKLIEGVTKLSRADIGEQPNLDEQIETLRKIFTLMEDDIRIMVIKLVDRLHNMQTVEFLPAEKQRVLAQETMEVYVKIADRLCMQDLRDELEGLCLNVLEPQVFARLLELRTQNEVLGQDILVDMRKRLQSHFPQHSHDVQMLFEHKSWDNLREQILAEGTAITGVSGVSIAFVCDDVDTCYRALGSLHQMWQRELLSFQDFINAPAINGYRGVHTTVILTDGIRVRCKMRTKMMHEYARKGIASLCFRTGKRDLPASLPWTQRITPLSEDTRGRSREFFETLQSDILGESIVIHGPADQTVLVPKGATALDGALYLFGMDALRLTSIKIGGHETRLDTPLEHAVSLNIILGDKEMVDRSWLESARTGLAMAAIRTALVRGKPDSQKVPLGKDLLQRTLSLHRRGFLEEFDERKLQAAMKLLGHSSLQDIYIAIADGRLEPSLVYRTLFEPPRTKRFGTGSLQAYTVKFSIPKNDIQVMRRLLDVYHQYAVQMKNVRFFSPPASDKTHFRLFIDLPEIGQEEFGKALRNAGAEDVNIQPRSNSQIPLLILIVLLWGLDPVVARLLLKQSISMVDLTFIRFMTFFATAIIAYATQTYFLPRTFKPLSPFQPTLFFSGLALFVTAAFTYTALQFIPASQYILFIIGGLVFTAFLRELIAKTSWWKSALSLLSMAGAIAILMQYHTPDIRGILSGVASALGFALYSVMSKRYQDRVGRIRERYPAYLFWVSTVCALLSLLFLPFTNFSSLSWTAILASIAFALVFAALPYILYFELMRRVENRLLDSTLPFVCISTLLAESLITRSPVPFISLPLLVVFFLLYTMRARVES